jgi:TPR repeat protein
MRLFVLILTVLALALSANTGALAQKTKTKPNTPAQTQQDTPSEPADIDAILDEADDVYYGENGQTQDFKRAFELYMIAAEAGDPYGMNRVGWMYDVGEYVAQDYEEAFVWYQRSADAGFPAAMNNVGSMYRYGDGVDQDLGLALDWLHRAVDAGHAYANFAIGEMYLGGEGVAKDPVEATSWFQRASDAGVIDSHWSLALRYLYGDGVAMDTRKAGDLAYLALVNGLEVALDEFKEIRTADTSPNFRRRIQELLKADGFYTGTIDGSFGPQTMRAIEAAFGSAL